jgi:hypothetical protein
MLSHEEFTAWIEVDGVKVPEYGIEVRKGGKGESETIITCWIASEPNKARYHSLHLVRFS